MSLSAQLRRRRRLPSSKMPQRLLMPVRLCSDAFASRLALLVPWLNPSVGAGQSSILDRHTCPEGILHVQKSLRMCERIQITNGLVSNKQVSAWDQRLRMSVLPAKARSTRRPGEWKALGSRQHPMTRRANPPIQRHGRITGVPYRLFATYRCFAANAEIFGLQCSGQCLPQGQ